VEPEVGGVIWGAHPEYVCLSNLSVRMFAPGCPEDVPHSTFSLPCPVPGDDDPSPGSTHQYFFLHGVAGMTMSQWVKTEPLQFAMEIGFEIVEVAELRKLTNNVSKFFKFQAAPRGTYRPSQESLGSSIQWDD